MSNFEENTTHDQNDQPQNIENVNETNFSESQDQNTAPSAPPAVDNGYIVVQPNEKESLESAVDKVLDSIENSISQQKETITKIVEEVPKTISETKPAEKSSDKKSAEKKCATGLCPYYALAMNKLENLKVHPQVRDLLLWRDPRLTGAVFGSSFVLLLSLASFSLLTVLGTILLLASTIIGAYRLYLALLFRIKGINDNTFEKLSGMDLTLPKDKFQQFATLLETDLNQSLNKLKSVLLWDNLSSSIKSFFVFYMIYWIGSIFNTLTLLILGLIFAFTLPKVYEIYKKPIDQALEKGTSFAHCAVKELMTKLPFLNKKKIQ